MEFHTIKRKALIGTWIIYFCYHLATFACILSVSLALGWRPEEHGSNWHNFYLEHQTPRQVCLLVAILAFNGPDFISVLLYIHLRLKLKRETSEEQSNATDTPSVNLDQSKTFIISTLRLHAFLCLLDASSFLVVTNFGTASLGTERYLGYMFILSVNGCWLPQIVIVNSFAKVNQALRACTVKGLICV